ncbi:hypothetical protein D3C72_1222230 [compost metagenome]
MATGPDRDGLAKTRSTVRIEDAGAVAAGGDAGCGLDWAKAEVAAIRIVEARRNVRMTAKLEAKSSAVIPFLRRLAAANSDGRKRSAIPTRRPIHLI